MNERLLQFIWQHSLYQPTALTTVDGETVTIVHPGLYNTNAGPDFLEAKVRVGKTLLAGHIELHVNTSDWDKHGHEHDEKYRNIVLHVVYHNDNGKSAANTPILELKKHIPKEVINNYGSLIQAPAAIPCSNHLHNIRSITKESWLTRMLAERWEEKLTDWKELLDSSAGDWSNLMYWRTAANFGFKVNTAPFLMLARSLPLNILAKHRENLVQIEALLFGQAGMLNEKFKEKYPNVLKAEYEYLAKKYKLQPILVHHWKFLRLRPANFPTVRIAQFAALVHKSLHLFSKIVELHTVKEIIPLLDVIASEYWNTHYQFGEPQEKPSKKHFGTSSIHNIIINTIAPIQFLYASQQGTSRQQEKALQLLEDVPLEKNSILERWNVNGWKSENAAQSQALIQLYNNYCSSKRCLDCSIGLSIFKSGPNK
jgi:hypothetical protein